MEDGGLVRWRKFIQLFSRAPSSFLLMAERGCSFDKGEESPDSPSKSRNWSSDEWWLTSSCGTMDVWRPVRNWDWASSDLKNRRDLIDKSQEWVARTTVTWTCFCLRRILFLWMYCCRVPTHRARVYYQSCITQNQNRGSNFQNKRLNIILIRGASDDFFHSIVREHSSNVLAWNCQCTQYTSEYVPRRERFKQMTCSCLPKRFSLTAWNIAFLLRVSKSFSA